MICPPAADARTEIAMTLAAVASTVKIAGAAAVKMVPSRDDAVYPKQKPAARLPEAEKEEQHGQNGGA